MIKLKCALFVSQNEQYGMSFINLHSPPDDTDGDNAEKAGASPSVTVSITKCSPLDFHQGFQEEGNWFPQEAKSLLLGFIFWGGDIHFKGRECSSEKLS